MKHKRIIAVDQRFCGNFFAKARGTLISHHVMWKSSNVRRQGFGRVFDRVKRIKQITGIVPKWYDNLC